MSRPRFADEGIQTRAHRATLKQFLQCSLEIGELSFRSADFRNLRPNEAVDQLSRRLKPGVQIHRAEDRFESVHEQGLLRSADRLFLTLSHVQVPPKIQQFGIPHEIGGADKKTFELRQLAFCKCRILPAERVADNEPENSISQELQLFIVFPGPLFVSMG